MGTEEAAAILGIPALTLRRALERNAKRVDGSVQAKLDGVCARKFARRWRIWLDPSWLEPRRIAE